MASTTSAVSTTSSYGPVKSEKSVSRPDSVPYEKKAKNWAWACKQHGVTKAKKGTPGYEAVLKIYQDANPIPLVPGSWSDCCAKLGYSFVKKLTPEYDRVMDLFLKTKDEQQSQDPSVSEDAKLWKQCCLSNQVSYCKKGTKVYDAVKREFARIKEQLEQQAESDPVLEQQAAAASISN